MDYRKWKELAKQCSHKGAGSGSPHKASSRGKGQIVCLLSEKKCQMSGCPLKENNNEQTS